MPYLFCTRCNLVIFCASEKLDDVKCPHCERNITQKNPRHAPEIPIEINDKQPVLKPIKPKKKKRRRKEEATKEHASDETRDDYVRIEPPEPPDEYYWQDLQNGVEIEEEPEEQHSEDHVEIHDYHPTQRRAQINTVSTFMAAFNIMAFFLFVIVAFVVRSYSKGASIVCISGAVSTAIFFALSLFFGKKRRR